MLIDTHTHVVSSDPQAYPRRAVALANGAWWESFDAGVEPFAEAVQRSAVDGVVLVQAAGAYSDDNRYLLDALDCAGPFVGAVIVDPYSGPDPVGRLRALARDERVRGVRLFHLPRPATPWLGGDDGVALVRTAAECGLSVAVCCRAEDAADLDRLAAQCPEVPLVLDHVGFPDLAGEPGPSGWPWSLADRGNVVVKFTPTMVEVGGRVWADAPTVLAETVARFGPDRVVWGSDWPQHRQAPTYGAQIEQIVGCLDTLPDGAAAAVRGANAARLWPGAWPDPDGSAT